MTIAACTLNRLIIYVLLQVLTLRIIVPDSNIKLLMFKFILKLLFLKFLFVACLRFRIRKMTLDTENVQFCSDSGDIFDDTEHPSGDDECSSTRGVEPRHPSWLLTNHLLVSSVLTNSVDNSSRSGTSCRFPSPSAVAA